MIGFQIEGSAGEFVGRNMTPESQLVMFVPDLCRPLRMHYAGSGEIEGLSYYKYEVNEKTFDNCKDIHIFHSIK